LKTRERAVWVTAVRAAMRDLPREVWAGSVSVSSSEEEEMEEAEVSLPDFAAGFAAYTSIPLLNSSPLIKNTFNTPAVATAANGISRPSVARRLGLKRFRRGIAAFRPRATPQEAETASTYDLISVEVERGVDLFALE